MNKKIVKLAIQDLVKNYHLDKGGYHIEQLPDDPYNEEIILTLKGPNFYDITIETQIPETFHFQSEVKRYLLSEIRTTVYYFNPDEVFNHYYEFGGTPFPPSVFAKYLTEDKAYFDSI